MFSVLVNVEKPFHKKINWQRLQALLFLFVGLNADVEQKGKKKIAGGQFDLPSTLNTEGAAQNVRYSAIFLPCSAATQRLPSIHYRLFVSINRSLLN